MSRRRHLASLALAASAMFGGLAHTASAPAAGCDNSWKAPVDGEFDDPTMWSAGHAPTASEDACITVDGSYTVVLRTTHGVRSLTLGGASGTQVLALVQPFDPPTEATALDQSAGFDIGANAVFEIIDPAEVQGAGTVTNAGTVLLTDDGGRLGSRSIASPFVNAGSVDVRAANASIGDPFTPVSFTNQGSVFLTDATRLTTFGSFTNAAGGTLETTGSAAVEVFGTYVQGDGTNTGNPIRVVGSIAYTGTGASSVIGVGTLSGNIAPDQTLDIRENGTVTAAASFTNAGTIILDDAGPHADSFAGFAAAGPGVTLTNTGTLRSSAGPSYRFLHINVLNRGVVAVDGSQLSLDDKPFSPRPAFSTSFTNQGIVTVTGQLLVSGQAFVNGETSPGVPGVLATTGVGQLVVDGGTFDQGAGANIGNPVQVIGGVLRYSGAGASSVEARGSGTLTLTGKSIAAGQTLTIAADCTHGGAVRQLTGTGAIGNDGTINLLPSASCGSAGLDAAGATLTNAGLLHVGGGGPNAASLVGTLKNKKTLSLDAGALLDVSGAYGETNKALLETTLASATSYGQLQVGGAAVLAGSLQIDTGAFAPVAGQAYTVLTTAARSGTWKSPKTAAGGGPQYVRVYGPTTAGFVVRQALLSATPSSGAAGTSTTTQGTGFDAGEQVTLTFKDRRKHVTTLTTVAVDSSGAFSQAVTIPAGASRGDGTLSATGQSSGFSASTIYTVS